MLGHICHEWVVYLFWKKNVSALSFRVVKLQEGIFEKVHQWISKIWCHLEGWKMRNEEKMLRTIMAEYRACGRLKKSSNDRACGRLKKCSNDLWSFVQAVP